MAPGKVRRSSLKLFLIVSYQNTNDRREDIQVGLKYASCRQRETESLEDDASDPGSVGSNSSAQVHSPVRELDIRLIPIITEGSMLHESVSSL